MTGILQGLAFGLLFLNSAAAIVTYFVLPTAFSIVANVGRPRRQRALDRPRHRADAAVRAPATSPARSGRSSRHGTFIWVVVPFVVGLWRMLRAEVK